MQHEPDTINSDGRSSRWTLIRDIAVLQIKLVVDGLRDFILVPISLLAGIISLVKSDSSSGSEFYELLRAGKKSERWINLFGAADRMSTPENEHDRVPDEDIDSMVSRVESFIVDEYRKGGVTTQAKERLDKAIDSLHKIASGKGRNRTSEN